MNRSMWFLVAAVASSSIILGLVLGYLNSQESQPVERLSVENPLSLKQIDPIKKEAVKPLMVNANIAVEDEKHQEPEEEVVEESEEPLILDQYAIDSMADARLNGDDRAPPIGQSVAREGPTEEEIESPELYLEYESRQEKKIYKAYVEAADIKIEMLEDQIAKARERGLPEEELNVGIEKVKRIKEMKAQLLLDNPDLQ